MALSRTARILIAVLLVAAAGFFWVNFFQQNQTVESTPTPLPGAAPAPLTTGNGVTGPAGGQTSGAIVTTPDENDPAAGVASTDPSAPAGAPGTAVQAPAPSTSPSAPVVVTDPPAVVLRDLVVEQLPFLVTEPPLALLAESELADGAAGRAVAAARANVNPFSPILVQAPPTPAAQPVAQTPAPSAEPQIVVVEGGAQPASSGGGTPPARTPVAAPAPRAVAPSGTRAAELPRALPSGTLTAVPDILRDARTQPTSTAGPANLGTVAAVVVPQASEGADLPFATREGQVTAATTPEPLGTSHGERATTRANSLPIAVGVDSLSRYLRDNNVRFTGQVLGPLSVGVFRSNLYQQPVVVTLGQMLPETDILLSDLRGYEAKFSLGDNTQVLSLDSRR